MITELRNKVEKAQRIMTAMVELNNPCCMPDRYYRVLYKMNEYRRQLNKELEYKRIENIEIDTQISDKEAATKKEYERAVSENMVTSATYKREFKRKTKEYHKFITK